MFGSELVILVLNWQGEGEINKLGHKEVVRTEDQSKRGLKINFRLG